MWIDGKGEVSSQHQSTGGERLVSGSRGVDSQAGVSSIMLLHSGKGEIAECGKCVGPACPGLPFCLSTA